MNYSSPVIIIYKCNEKVSSVKKSLRTVEISGDALSFTAELSRSFFSTIYQANCSFVSLFGEHCEKPVIISLLVVWIQEQMSSFAEVLSRQVELPFIVKKIKKIYVCSITSAE